MRYANNTRDNEKKLGPNRGCDGNFEGYFTFMAWISRNSYDLFTIYTRLFLYLLLIDIGDHSSACI